MSDSDLGPILDKLQLLLENLPNQLPSKVRSGEEVTHKYLLGRVAVSRLVTAETLKRDILLFRVAVSQLVTAEILKRDILLFAYTGRASYWEVVGG
jgi:hypothetical protein